MPQMVNGIGTTYRNSKNHRHRPGTCQRCHRSGQLQSYDTEKWFVILLIPVYKIETLHIVSYCPHCTAHGAVPVKEWEKRRAETVAPLLAQYRENPRDGSTAVQLLDASDYFEDTDTYNLAFKEVKENLGDDPDVLAYMARLALQNNQVAEATRLYERIVEVDGYNFDAHDMLMLLAVDAKDLATAEKRAAVLIDNASVAHAPRLIPLVQYYQELGRHQPALDLMDKIEDLSPETAKEPDFARLRELSRTYLATSRPLKKTGFEFGAGERRRRRRNGLIAAGVIVGGIGVVYLGYCLILSRREPLWLVNSTPMAYSVSIDGRELVLPPDAPSKVALGLGRHQIAPGQGAPAFKPVAFEMTKSLLGLPFSQDVFVGNPDQMGVFIRMVVHYGHHDHGDGRQPEMTLLRGQPFLRVNNIDHPFEKPPDTISSRAGSPSPVRSVLAYGNFGVVLTAPEQMDRAERIAFAKEALEKGEGVGVFLVHAIFTSFPPTDFLEIFKDRFPLGFEDRRQMEYFLGAASAAGRLPEYSARLDAALAKETTTTLLLGRALVEPAPDRSLACLEQAAALSGANDEARGLLASALLRRGRDAEALNILRGLGHVPESANRAFCRYLAEHGEFDQLQALISTHEEPVDGDLDAMLEASISDQGHGVVDLGLLAVSEGQEERMEHVIKAEQLYAAGKRREAAWEFAQDTWSGFEAGILRADLQKALEDRNYGLGGVGFDDLILYLAASHSRNVKIAAIERPRAIQHLRRLLPGGPVIADMLDKARPADAALALAADMGRGTHQFALAMLALEHAELRPELVPAILKRNTARTFPAGEISAYLEFP